MNSGAYLCVCACMCDMGRSFSQIFTINIISDDLAKLIIRSDKHDQIFNTTSEVCCAKGCLEYTCTCRIE